MNMRIINDITDFIFVTDEPTKSDVIFLPGGSFATIPEMGAELYRNGFAPFLIPSGGVGINVSKFGGVCDKPDIYTGDYETECAFFTDVLQINGVPSHAIFEENQSSYTKENATISRKVADEHGLAVRTAMIVCKSFHTRRCLMCYQFAFPEADIRVISVDVYGITRDNWHKQAHGVERVLGELARCGNQFGDEMKVYSNLP